MISPAEYQRRLDKVRRITVLRELMYKEIMIHETFIRYLKESEFEEGDIYGDGTLVPYRSQSYSLWKASRNPKAGGAVDLMVSHDFVDAMFIKKPLQNRYSFGNRDWKRNLLANRYGNAIFGLNQDDFDEFQVRTLLPRFIIDIKEFANIG